MIVIFILKLIFLNLGYNVNFSNVIYKSNMYNEDDFLMIFYFSKIIYHNNFISLFLQ